MAKKQTEDTKEIEKDTQQAPKVQFGIERIYLKDLSLESPLGAAAFSKAWKPRVNLDINSSQSKLDEDLYEVVLKLTVTTKDDDSDETLYLVEIHQAGSFRARGLAGQELQQVLATVAPATLFPYARETVDSIVNKANFPPLRLAPINFDLLFAQAIQKHKEGAESETVQ